MSSTSSQKSHRVADFLAARWLAIVLIVLAGVFVAQNRDPMSISVLWTHVTAPMWVLLAILFVAGFAAGSIVSQRRSRSRQR